MKQESVDPNAETVKQTFTEAFKADVQRISSLKELKELIYQKGVLENAKGNVGIDETGINFADDIIKNIRIVELKKDRGEAITEEDFSRITRMGGIRPRVQELVGDKS